MNEESTLSGWWVFAGALLLIAGVLNIIYGIAAIGDSKFFTANATYILSSLHTWGWVSLILGVLELIAAFSLFAGGEFGRWFGIFIASLNAIGALLSIPLTRSGRWRYSPSRSSSSTSWPRARRARPPSSSRQTRERRRPRNHPGAFVLLEDISAHRSASSSGFGTRPERRSQADRANQPTSRAGPRRLRAEPRRDWARR